MHASWISSMPQPAGSRASRPLPYTALPVESSTKKRTPEMQTREVFGAVHVQVEGAITCSELHVGNEPGTDAHFAADEMAIAAGGHSRRFTVEIDPPVGRD